MNEQSKTITRAELYENIWKTPATKLAQSWGVSYASLVKACEQMNVPRPDSRHWQLVARGWKLEPERLPDAEPDTPLSVTVGPKAKPNTAKAKVEEPKQEPSIQIAESLRHLHPLIQKLHELMKAAEQFG